MNNAHAETLRQPRVEAETAPELEHPSDEEIRAAWQRPEVLFPAAVLAVVTLVHLGGPRGVIGAGFTATLVVLAAIDLRYRILPNRIVLPATAAVLFLQIAFYPESAVEWVACSLGAALFLLLPTLFVSSGIGMGDVKLALLLGAMLGSRCGRGAAGRLPDPVADCHLPVRHPGVGGAQAGAPAGPLARVWVHPRPAVGRLSGARPRRRSAARTRRGDRPKPCGNRAPGPVPPRASGSLRPCRTVGTRRGRAPHRPGRWRRRQQGARIELKRERRRRRGGCRAGDADRDAGPRFDRRRLQARCQLLPGRGQRVPPHRGGAPAPVHVDHRRERGAGGTACSGPVRRGARGARDRGRQSPVPAPRGRAR